MVDLQEDEKSCFRAVVREAYRLSYGHMQSVYCPLDGMSNDLLSMRCGLKRLGIDSQGVQVDSPEVLSGKCIFIAHVNRNGLDHFVLVRRRREDKYLVYDPAFGYLWMDRDELWEIMDGRGLMVFKNRRRLSLHDRMPAIIKRGQSLLLSLISMIRCTSIVLFMYTFNRNTNWTMPLVMGMVFVLSIIANFLLNDKLAKDFAMNVCIPFKNSSTNPESFKDSLSVMTQEIRIENDLLNRMTLLVVAFFVAINMDRYVCLAFSIDLLICFLARWMARPKLEEYKARIAYEECRSLKCNGDAKFKNVWGRSRRYAVFSTMLDMLSYVLAFAISIVTSLIKKTMSLELLVNELIFVGGASGFVARIIDVVDDYALVRKNLYRCGTKLTEMLKKREDDGMIFANRDS